jgi:hypothetical protein
MRNLFAFMFRPYIDRPDLQIIIHDVCWMYSEEAYHGQNELYLMQESSMITSRISWRNMP